MSAESGMPHHPTALVPLATGFEEIEAVTLIDLLRRGGFEVTVAGLSAGSVTGAHGLAVVPDASLTMIAERSYTLIALPGGSAGADRLASDQRLRTLLQHAVATGCIVGAICAAPRVLARAGLLDKRRVTSYPGALDNIVPATWIYCNDPVVIDDRLVTSRGPGTAMDFSLSLIEITRGLRQRRRVESLLKRP